MPAPAPGPGGAPRFLRLLAPAPAPLSVPALAPQVRLPMPAGTLALLLQLFSKVRDLTVQCAALLKFYACEKAMSIARFGVVNSLARRGGPQCPCEFPLMLGAASLVLHIAGGVG